MTKRLNFIEQQAALDRLEVTLRNRIGREINRYLREYAKAYQDNDQMALPLIDIKHRDKVHKLLADNIVRTAPRFGRLALSQIKRETKATEPSFFQRLIDEWLLTEGLKHAVSIAETSKARIAQAIQIARQDDISVFQVAKAIRRLTALTPSRASTIARTETHNAALFASKRSAEEAQIDLGITLTKEWLPAEDSRTRPAHAAMAGKIIDMDAKFNVGGEMMDRPSDPKASASNVINCRCVLVYAEKKYNIE